jgi:hypothetical protein
VRKSPKSVDSVENAGCEQTHTVDNASCSIVSRLGVLLDSAAPAGPSRLHRILEKPLLDVGFVLLRHNQGPLPPTRFPQGRRFGFRVFRSSSSHVHKDWHIPTGPKPVETSGRPPELCYQRVRWMFDD